MTDGARRSRTYEWETARLDPAALAGLSGLEFLRQMADGTIPGASITATLDFRVVTLEEGRVVFEGTPGDAVLNPLGGVHGGYAATLLDTLGVRKWEGAKRAQKEAFRFWAIGLLCSVVGQTYTLYRLREREAKVDKKEGEGVVEAKRIAM